MADPVPVMFTLNAAKTLWVARGYSPVYAPPYVVPPAITPFLLNDPGSLLNGSKVLV